MENASKALIIAGAILLAILLISLGIMVFNNASETANNNGLSEQEMTTFNSKFLKYEGEIKGSEVKTLIQEVNASNANANNQDNGWLVGIGKTITSVEAFSSSGSISNKTYTVSCSYGTNGVVNQITISLKNS